jgi:hypothetical protein
MCPRPERWMNKENNPASESIPGVWGSQMTFIGTFNKCCIYQAAMHVANLGTNWCFFRWTTSLHVSYFAIGTRSGPS